MKEKSILLMYRMSFMNSSYNKPLVYIEVLSGPDGASLALWAIDLPVENVNFNDFLLQICLSQATHLRA